MKLSDEELREIEARDQRSRLAKRGIGERSHMAEAAHDRARLLEHIKALEEWQPIETAPRDRKVWFWIVPKSSSETYQNTSSNPIVDKRKPRKVLRKYGSWPALWKAVYWCEPWSPTPPEGGSYES